MSGTVALPQDPIPDRPLSSKDLTARLSKQLANFRLGDAAIQQLSERMLVDGLSMVRFNPCVYGICIDYFSDKVPHLDMLPVKQGVVKWEVFPYGILGWDRFHIRVALQVDGLEGKVAMRDLEH